VVPQALAGLPRPDELYYDQVAQIEIPRWSADRVVLVGDACQAVSLLAGQGASMAMGGAYVLGELLADGGRIDAALAAYEAVWRPGVVEKQAAGRRGASWFLPSNNLQLLARRTVMRTARLPVLTRLIASTVTGRQDTPLATVVERGIRERRQPGQRW
jgi:2-polyprenyl-6-methoxyphenol hydroxylase-like FAD-dependent oxidoreductase